MNNNLIINYFYFIILIIIIITKINLFILFFLIELGLFLIIFNNFDLKLKI